MADEPVTKLEDGELEDDGYGHAVTAEGGVSAKLVQRVCESHITCTSKAHQERKADAT